ncbi:hypothetical protein TSUD_102520 [Trifolium subterraneum]|uniref:Uncharacterized protein n=1 Tax=Trifolium subterraneum TaxID=3900 RepID=A0A2Z6MN21_TRISU|nr:hypothetical protein TSUD_102520 [Trifolium subterraneum]
MYKCKVTLSSQYMYTYIFGEKAGIWEKPRPVCRLTCSGISLLISSGDAPDNCSYKLKRGGRGRPLGSRALDSRSSSKKGCAHASS